MHEPTQQTNRLLSLLSDTDYARLRPHLSQVVLEYKKSLYEASRPIRHVFFPIEGVASLVITTADGASAEVGTIGSEGMVGLPVCLGDTDAPSSVYVQVPGTALGIDAHIFRGELDRSPTLNLIMLLTPDFLGMMLGVRRTTVTEVMGNLQKAGLIRYRRGHVTILDREALRRRACECYDISRLEFDRLLGDTAGAPRTAKKHRLISEVG